VFARVSILPQAHCLLVTPGHCRPTRRRPKPLRRSPSSSALDKLPGSDPAGYAGLEDGVDWHSGRVLAGAALATMLGASSELAVSDQGSTNVNVVIALRNSAQDATNQVGQEITRRNLSIQPSLTVRPGFPMDMMVNKDLVLRPYQPLFFERRTP
jgi:type IV secretion system protein TrbI